MRRGLAALLCAAFAVALPAAAAGARPKLTLVRGQAFRVAGTRVGCSVGGPATAPSVECGLWGRTTHFVPGTLSMRIGEEAVDIFQRPLEGELALLAELAQPPAPAPQGPPPEERPARTTTLFAGDVATIPGTDLFCAVVRDVGLGARCGLVDPATGQFLAGSALATLSDTSVLTARINPHDVAVPGFFQRQPFIPAAATVGRELRALARASRRLPDLRRAYRGTRRGERQARKGLRAIVADLRNDRYIAACLRFDPLLYHSFYLPRGSLAGGKGLRFAASVRRIEHALCN
ncbi:MAG TPA: hypothetical protein VE596_14760 [Gaiellaceae bacterium]|jgi:hypothetical protein|nr:hypothetical protein [Gaiellaceae bacterium]